MRLIEIGKGQLLPVHTDKFKTELLTVTQAAPYDRREVGLCTLLHHVLKRGCRAYPTTADINRRLDDLYDANITMGCSTTGDNFTCGASVETLCRDFIPDGVDALAGALDVVSEMLKNPLLDGDGLFRSEYFEGEIQSMVDRLRASNNSSKARSSLICQGLMFDGELYGQRTFSSEDEIRSVKNEDLAQYYKKLFTISAPLFIYVGPRSDEEVEALIRERFSFLKGERSALCKTFVKSHEGEIRRGDESMAVNQGKLTMGLRADIGMTDSDAYAALVFNDIFGGSPASKLFRNVRERLSLCYSCGSSYDFTKGVVFVRSGIANENYDSAVGEILHQLDLMKKGDISDFEFDAAKKALVSGYMQVTDSTYATESFYRTRILNGCTDTVETVAEKIGRVTLGDVVRVAQRFNPSAIGFVRGELDGEEADFDEE